MKTNLSISLSLLAGFASLVACGGDPNSLDGRGGGSGDGTATPPSAQTPPVDPGDPSLCTGRSYKGFDNKELSGDRAVAKIGVDRSRLKQFSALQTEYPRVLGNTPASLAGSGATFGAPEPRWFDEPEANAVALETAYDIAFDGCLTYVASDSQFASAPTAANASAPCAAMAQKFWSKTPAPTEIAACVDVAVNAASTETDTARKWAYACASVLTSAGFLAY